MPKASENASAIAIVNIPPRITSFEWVPECKPTIRPKVVMIPEVSPKQKPFLIDSFIDNASLLTHLFTTLTEIIYYIRFKIVCNRFLPRRRGNEPLRVSEEKSESAVKF